MESLEALKEQLTKVIAGEIEPSDAGVDSEEVTFTAMPELSLRSLKAEHYRLSLVAAGAKSVGLGTLEQTAKLSLEYIAVLAKKFINQSLTPMVVSGEDVAETALALITEVEHSTTLGHRASEVSEMVVIQDEKDVIKMLTYLEPVDRQKVRSTGVKNVLMWKW